MSAQVEVTVTGIIIIQISVFEFCQVGDDYKKRPAKRSLLLVDNGSRYLRGVPSTTSDLADSIVPSAARIDRCVME